MDERKFMEKVHIGGMIENIASQKNVTPKQLGELINRYKDNETKLFRMKNMNLDDVVKISYLLRYNILEILSQQYLSHIPIEGSFTNQEQNTVTFCLKTKSYKSIGNSNNCYFLNNIDVGRRIKVFAKENGWREHQVAQKLYCGQSTVSDLYKRKSMSVKKLFYISDCFHYNFVYELYLSRMTIVPSLEDFNQCIITIDGENACVKNPNDENFSIIFRPQDNL